MKIVSSPVIYYAIDLANNDVVVKTYSYGLFNCICILICLVVYFLALFVLWKTNNYRD